MPRSMNQKSKLLCLMQILLEETDETHGLSTAELIDALARHGIAAERKALYNDLEILQNFGIRIEQRKDRTTRYHVVGREFELAELKFLVDAVQASKFLTEHKSRALIRKLSGLASRHDATKLARQVHVSNRIKTMDETVYKEIDTIHEAINAGVQITFRYFDWNEKKQKVLRHAGRLYEVSPWTLVWDDENYYLIAYDELHGAIRHYRVDRMQSISLSTKKRSGRELFEDFDLGAYSKKTFGMFSGDEELVTLRCHNGFAGAMIDRFGRDVTFLPVDGEHFEFRTRVKISPTFYSWVTIFEGKVEITAPEKVREGFASHLETILGAYRKDGAHGEERGENA